MRTTGVTSRGIVTPVFQQGDDLVKAVTESVCNAAANEGFALHDRDIVAVTEAVVGRTQGNNTVCSCCHLQLRQETLLSGLVPGEHTGFTDGQFTHGCAEDTVGSLVPEKGRFMDKRAGGIVDGLILSEHGRSSPF